MRPIRLELEGFTSFREKTVVEFGDAELFVLWGPTGSGKSSLIDAITFALYGSVSRYQNESLVHPVISQGKQEARVRLDFSLGGRTYTAVRVVRRQKRKDSWGAVAKEVRLECGDEVLAGNARELAAEVKRLFGLSFAQFTTCVVLPQGEFARFLQASGAERQDLLKDLLRLQVYDRMARAARSRAEAAKVRVQVLEATLSELGFATDDALRAEKQHGERLAELAAKVDAAQPPLATWVSEIEARTQEATRYESAAKRLGAVVLPAGVESLHDQDVEARKRASDAADQRAAAERAVEVAEAKRGELPADVHALRVQLQGYDALAKQRALVEQARAADEQAGERRASASAGQEAARGALEAARAAVAAVENAHRAHALAADLAPGDPCPVCHRTLADAPHHDAPPGLAAAQKQLAQAEAAAKKAEAALQKAIAASGSASSDRANAEASAKQLEDALADAAPRDELTGQLAAVEQADRQLEAARGQLKQLQEQERSATRGVDELAASVRSARARFGEARDSVGGLQPDAEADAERWRPPPGDDDDLVASWRALLAWCEARRDELETLAGDAKRAAANAQREREAALVDLTAACAACEVEVGSGQSHAQRVAGELARSESERSRIAEALERAKAARRERKQGQSAGKVASALAGHLRATAFERWLLTEAFDQLVRAASVRLGELSGGMYSFSVDDKLDFQIVDHRNADESRSARTLSGGETFLASLALALTLAEQVAALAADGAAPLESMFLDEGFGTLDPETLDTVASSIEELGARGRMVGLVTHVRDLADRIPTQFRVSRNPSGSVVERVSQ